MKEKIIDFEDLSYSREMLEAKAPNFIAIFIYLLLLLISVALGWMWFGEIDVVVKANGVVRPAQNDSLVQNVRGGKLEQLKYKEGKRVKQGELLYAVDTDTLNLRQGNIDKKITEVKRKISKLLKLEKSIQQNKNLFSKSAELRYYNRYLTYKFKREQLRISYNQAKDKYEQEKSLSPSATTESRLKELKANYRSAKLELESHKNKILVNIKDELEAKRDKLTQLEQEYEDITDKIDLSRVEAPVSGTIHVIRKFNQGDYMPSGIEVLRIIPDTGSNYEMEITVSNKNISELETGQQVKYRFLSLPYKEYGTLKGKITKISSDASMSSQKKSKLPYNVKATIEGTKLYDKKGKPEYIKPGMISKARVVVRQKKILYFVLEKLDFIS